ncbi:MAG: DUF1302 domain-containing protein [Zavarzinia sp.]|nr:DUF1302 domain-containing protein [Zavarzinia sp.]
MNERAMLAALAAACALGSGGGAAAETFNVGQVDITVSAVVSAGIMIRTDEPNSEFIAAGNKPGGTASSSAFDDASLNFDRGDVVSSPLKALGEVKFRYGDFGANFSGKAWYDYELDQGDRAHGNIVNHNAPGVSLDDSGFDNLAKVKGIALLDAYVYGMFDIGDMPLDLRVGRQVVSWGEATFIGGGINSINPIDVSAFRRPGAEIKEGLMPVGLVYGNLGLTEALSLEAFYQLEWRPTVIDGCGTFFSTIDGVAKGCNGLTISAAQNDATTAMILGRGDDIEPDDGGQYGVSLRYYARPIDVEFGAYYLNYHSRTPYISVVKHSATNGGPFIPGNPSGGNFGYRVDYPEDIHLFGLSFATAIEGASVYGEISHRPNMPVALNANDLLSAFLTGGTAPNSPLSPIAASLPFGALFPGYDEARQTRVQASMLKVFPPMLGAGSVSFIAEAGAEFLGGLDEDRRYGRPTVFGSATYNGICTSTTDKKCQAEGFVTSFSWGYRARAIFDYPDAFMGVNAKPFLSWSHDVQGYSADGSFSKGRMGLGVGVDFDYQAYSLGASWTSFFGGDYHYGNDRDFLSLSASVRF